MQADKILQQLASPCTGICELNTGKTHCIGCLRSVEEIGQWSSYSDSEKRSLLQQLEQRREILHNQ